MHRIGLCAAALQLLILSNVPIHAQERLSAEMLFPALVRATESAEYQSSSLKDQLLAVRRELTTLVAALERLPGGVPQEYEKTFAEYSRQIGSLSTDVSGPVAVELIRDILDDLQLKNRFISTGFGFSARTKHLVELRVTTVDLSGKTVHGYEIAYDSKRFAGRKGPLFPFGKLSSPTIQSVPPGLYTVQVFRDGRIVNSKEDVRVGLSGSDHEAVEILIR